MIDFKQYQCRHCKHWHYNMFTQSFAAHVCYVQIPRPDATAVDCGCNNWQSADNLVYLEALDAKRPTKD